MIEIIINALLEEKNLVAHETMQSPGDGSPYEYGRRIGHYAGLDRALAIINEALAAEEGTEHGSSRHVGKRWVQY